MRAGPATQVRRFDPRHRAGHSDTLPLKSFLTIMYQEDGCVAHAGVNEMQPRIERRSALCVLLGAVGGGLLASGSCSEAAQMPNVEARAEEADRVLLQQIAETVDFAAEQQAIVLTEEERRRRIEQIYQALADLRRQSRR